MEQEWPVQEITAMTISADEGMLFQVYWVGYPDPTWEPYEYVCELAALDVFLANLARLFYTNDRARR